MATAAAGSRERLVDSPLTPDGAHKQLAPLISYLSGDSRVKAPEILGYTATPIRYLVGEQGYQGLLSAIGNRPLASERGGLSYARRNLPSHIGGQITVDRLNEGKILVITAETASAANLDRQHTAEWGDKAEYLRSLDQPFSPDRPGYLLRLVIAADGKLEEAAEFVKMTHHDQELPKLIPANKPQWGVVPAGLLVTLRQAATYEVNQGSANGATEDRQVSIEVPGRKISEVWRKLPNIPGWEATVFGRVPTPG